MSYSNLRPLSPQLGTVQIVTDFVDTTQSGITTKTNSDRFDFSSVLTSTSHTAYLWNIGSDEILWAPNASKVLNIPVKEAIPTGRHLNFHIDARHSGRRYESIANAEFQTEGTELPFSNRFAFMPEGRNGKRSYQLVETGSLTFDLTGKPLQVAAVLRVVREGESESCGSAALTGRDGLTGQLDRARIDEILASVVNDPEYSSKKCAFLLAAVDSLATINETIGFKIGDEVIAAVGQRLGNKLRGRDFIGRHSSNKFGILLIDCEPEELEIAAQRLIQGVDHMPVSTSIGDLSVTCSIGGVMLPKHADTVDQAVGCGLEALERAKSVSPGRFENYQPSGSLNSIRQRNISIVEDVNSALRENRLFFAMQPIVDAETYELELSECLLRLKKRDGTIISASEFIPIAERLGLSRAIDFRVQELAIDFIKNNPDQKISLNISSLSTNCRRWLDRLASLTQGSFNLVERVTVEITETAAIKDLEKSMEFVRNLKALGCKVAIDDFGVGCSSFRNLRKLDADMVKIDGSFIQNLSDCDDDRLFVEMLISLAQKSGMASVAECVTDQKTAEFLNQAGVTYLQGYYFGEPKLV